MFDIDKNSVLSKDSNRGRIASYSQFEVAIYVVQLTHFDLVLKPLQTLLGLGQFFHASQGFLDEGVSVNLAGGTTTGAGPLHAHHYHQL